MATPIWKDYFVNLGTSDSMYYRLLVEGEVIYSGRAFKRPGQTYNEVRINDICADYLTNVLPTMAESLFSALTFPITFTVESSSSGSGWTTVESVQFMNDWSYDYEYNPATMGLSFPINGHIDKRQWLIISEFQADSIEVDLVMRDGNISTYILPVAISDDFNDDFNSDFARSVRSAQTGTAVFDLLSLEGNADIVKVIIGNRQYEVVSDCKRYALYYSNAYGGWDSFLIEGNVKEADNVTRHIREIEYDNRSSQNRGRQNYVNELDKTFVLHTSWLNDNEAARMHHLLNSTDVYLYDINTGEMMPVVITNTTTEYKTFKGNGGKLVNYSINVSLAQDRIRR